jgi:hypothetical protein
VTEKWRPIPGFEGRYEVSDHGRVRSLRYRGHPTVQIMKSTPNYAGYYVITLGKERKQFRLHCLVLEAFVGPRPAPDFDGCHKSGDKRDNTLSNLRWDTKPGNMRDRRSYDGDANPNSKLTTEQMREMALRYISGESLRKLKEEYGVNSMIHHARKLKRETL